MPSRRHLQTKEGTPFRRTAGSLVLLVWMNRRGVFHRETTGETGRYRGLTETVGQGVLGVVHLGLYGDFIQCVRSSGSKTFRLSTGISLQYRARGGGHRYYGCCPWTWCVSVRPNCSFPRSTEDRVGPGTGRGTEVPSLAYQPRTISVPISTQVGRRPSLPRVESYLEGSLNLGVSGECEGTEVCVRVRGD